MKADYNPEVTQSDLYLNSVYLDPSGLNLNVGIRYNHHNAYKGHWTYSLNPSYSFDLNADYQMKILSSYSKAFIAPGLYQLYDPSMEMMIYCQRITLVLNWVPRFDPTKIHFLRFTLIVKKIRHLFLDLLLKDTYTVGMPIQKRKSTIEGWNLL